MNHGVDREGTQSFAPLGQVGYFVPCSMDCKITG